MHRIPKFLIHRSEQRKTRMNSSSNSGGSRRQAASKQKLPRLERRNANNNINYELYPSTPSTSSSSYYSSEDSSLRTRSLELYSDKKSFRIEGIEGEIDIICNALGFSGVDDFGISPAEYESVKFRSSSAPLIVNRKIEADTRDIDAGINDDVGSSIRNVIIREKNEGFSENPSVSGRVDELTVRFGDSARVGDEISSEIVSSVLNEFRGNGSKGVRLPVLAPVPALTLPVIENPCSPWDLLLKGERVPDYVVSLERGQEEGRRMRSDEREEDREEDNMRMVVMRSENVMISESPSFTTSNDDDSSSTTTEPTSNISPNGRFRRIIMGWQKGGLLGRGSFGTVYEGIDDGGFFFAVKEVSLLDQGEEGKQSIIQLEQEISLLSQFEHENIVQYYGAIKDESNLYIFLELVTQGSLLSLYQQYKLQDSQVSAYTRQILHGLKYLHDRDVVHRDIKCANILVDASGSVKLADFGLAKATKLNDVKSCKGTAFWMAPEVVRSRGYGHAADIWSLGCTVLEMLTRRFPYFNLECVSSSTLLL
ncbi:mitogen-activated kinase kinase kinase 1-like [Olea europaea subsp. europaea]|uniref:mitogen-activated protein kinase kinase kinase n=1 Tax=Olea europaea subsp. europaea TaxID=158383 RepID=A0A8S0V175_OLEEU|nr:mitogen-activated kinase kinase kinase 1-like [Olea europaea subsp. europaea]